MDSVKRLIDERNVIQTIHRLVQGADDREWDVVEVCFAPRVRFDMTSMTGGDPTELSPSDITSAWKDGLTHLEAVHHQLGNFSVEIDGDRASAFCYGTAFHYLPNPSGRNTRMFVGTYDFELARDGGGWVVDLIRFNLKFIEGNTDLEQYISS